MLKKSAKSVKIAARLKNWQKIKKLAKVGNPAVKSRRITWLVVFLMYKFKKTSLRFQSLIYLVTASSLAWFGCKVKCVRKPENPVDSTWKLENSRFTVLPDIAVESSRGAWGHSRSYTQWSQARLLFFKNSKINSFKNTADQVALRDFNDTHVGMLLKMMFVTEPKIKFLELFCHLIYEYSGVDRIS